MSEESEDPDAVIARLFSQLEALARRRRRLTSETAALLSQLEEQEAELRGRLQELQDR